MTDDNLGELQDQAVAMMDELARAAWTIVTRADTMFDDSGLQTGVVGMSLADTLPTTLRRLYRDLRTTVDISALDGWAGHLIPLEDVTW